MQPRITAFRKMHPICSSGAALSETTILERWLSGRKRRSRKPLIPFRGFWGSNPHLSALCKASKNESHKSVAHLRMSQSVKSLLLKGLGHTQREHRSRFCLLCSRKAGGKMVIFRSLRANNRKKHGILARYGRKLTKKRGGFLPPLTRTFLKMRL